ncbi:transcriptional repressor LexA [Nitrospira sp. Kam-Ns4a]
MQPHELKRARQELGWTQAALAAALGTARETIARYEIGTRRIPGLVAVAIRQLAALPRIPLVGTVVAGTPLEAFPQADGEQVEVPRSMVRRRHTFALRVKGDSMRDDGILPGDLVVVQKQGTARNGQTVIALLNGEATIKTYHRKGDRIELHSANETMPPIVVQDTDRLQIEGIVVGVIRHLSP